MPLLSAKSIGSLECQNKHNAYETTKSLINLSPNNCTPFMTVSGLQIDVENGSPEQMQCMKRYREKCNVLKEMLSSEKKYIHDISEIVEGYYDEIAKTLEDNPEFMYHIFSNIKEILEFTK